MTMTTEVRPDLAALTDEELAAQWCRDDADAAALREEDDRRERNRRQAASRRWLAQRDWQDMAHAQYLAAESECAGVLLNHRGIAAGIEPFALWSGSQWTRDAYMSEELRDFWSRHPLVTWADWKRQQGRSEESYRDELDADERDAVRRDAGGGREGTAGRGDGRAHAVPGPDARAEAQGPAGPRADAGRGPAVRRPAVRSADEIRASVAARQQLAQRAAEIRAEAGPVRVLTAEDPVVVIPGPRPWSPVAPAESGPVREPVREVAVREPSAVVQPVRGELVRRQEIDGDQVLRYLYTFLKRFAVWGSDAEVVTAALWIAQAHAKDDEGLPIWDYCARLGIFGPSGSGKSWKSRLIAKLCPAGNILIEPTKPSFIDMIADRHTVVITEADEMFYTSGKSRGILAVVNASYERDRENTRKSGGKVVRVVLFGHVVLDGLDTMLEATRPDLRTMLSRTIIMRSATAPEGYRPPRFDRQARTIAEALSQRTAAWMAQETADGMADDVPPVPEHLGNRPFALWLPLFTVALRADKGDPDGPWSQACAQACEVLEAGAPVIGSDAGEVSELDRAMAQWDEEL